MNVDKDGFDVMDALIAIIDFKAYLKRKRNKIALLRRSRLRIVSGGKLTIKPL